MAISGGISEGISEGAACAPNISPAGRRARRRQGQVWLAITVLGAGAGLVWRLPAVTRGLVFVPAALSAIAFLQARRHTCVLRAAQGTFEHDDGSTTAAASADVAASRRTSWAIARDALLFGLLGGGLSATTALIR